MSICDSLGIVGLLVLGDKHHLILPPSFGIYPLVRLAQKT